jgi:hypothetical protein
MATIPDMEKMTMNKSRKSARDIPHPLESKHYTMPVKAKANECIISVHVILISLCTIRINYIIKVKVLAVSMQIILNNTVIPKSLHSWPRSQVTPQTAAYINTRPRLQKTNPPIRIYL